MNGDFLATLRRVNGERLAAWCEGGPLPDATFHAMELGGEVGEVLNVVKKLEREAKGWRGSRATVADLTEELGDVLICLDKLAALYGIDLAAAAAAKFNATSDKVGLPHRLSAAAEGFPAGAMYRSGHDGTGPDPSQFFCEAVSDAPECRRVRTVAGTEAQARAQAAARLREGDA